MQYCKEGWPDRVDGSLKQYFPVRLELSVHDGLLLQKIDWLYQVQCKQRSSTVYTLVTRESQNVEQKPKTLGFKGSTVRRYLSQTQPFI